ncbi:MAG: membrane protein insertion efficiency factor YidD [Gammaproteobacteria bacterium]
MHRLIRIYQKYMSPWFAPSCRFSPSCSEYARQAIGRFGTVRGSWLAVRRILRCNPLCRWGNDPVPQKFSWWRPASIARVPEERTE